MPISGKPTEQDKGLLSAYNTDAQDSSTASDTELAPVRTGADCHDRGHKTRSLVLAGMVCTIIFSYTCITIGIVIIAALGGYGVAPTALKISIPLAEKGLTLLLSLIVTLCTECIGFAHNVALRSALASESPSRLRFNTNLRLLTAVGSWRNPNGALLNGIMAVLLILSYISASQVLSFTQVNNSQENYVGIAGLPLLLLGTVILLQAVITLSGVLTVTVLTWSSSPFALTAALVHHRRLIPVQHRCMCCVIDVDCGPTMPLNTQPSAWRVRPSIRKVVIFLWVLVIACGAWALLVKYFSSASKIGPQSWLLTGPEGYAYSIRGSWILSSINIALFQGPLTLGLHCSELILNVIRDEHRWRDAGSNHNGLDTKMNKVKSVKSFLTNWLGLFLFVAKSVLHWMFGNSFCLFEGLSDSGTVDGFFVVMYTLWIFYLFIALLVLASFFTLLANRQQSGFQPAAYGHLQTLANLVDEWSDVMWWGHKEGSGSYCHAGTSSKRLPDVTPGRLYAGSSVSTSLIR